VWSSTIPIFILIIGRAVCWVKNFSVVLLAKKVACLSIRMKDSND
jgi:hypothetical protein